MSSNALREMLREALCDTADEGLALLAEVRKTPGAATASAWAAILDDASLCRAFVDAIRRSGALSGTISPRARLIVEDLVDALGRHRFAPAAELLEQLWNGPQVHAEVRVRVGHALLDAGDSRSLRVLSDSLGQESGAALTLALQGAFSLDRAHAHDLIAPLLERPGDHAEELREAVLRVLMNDVLDGQRPGAKPRGWFAADPRWLDLCVRWAGEPRAPDAVREIAAWLRDNA